MIRSSYSVSPYGKMRDRQIQIQNEAKAKKEAKRKRKQEEYYTWLVAGVR